MLPTADTNEIERDWNVEMMYVKKKVMTDEQIETLRKQIAAYGTICEQLVQMHKTHSSNQHLTGVRGMYFDPMITKIGSRQRWAPTTVQLQTLEQIFNAETGTPSKEKIKEITANLTKHGQISETNVYNWFQNRRARSKRKQQSLTPTIVNSESEVETNVDSKDKNTKPDEFVASKPAENLCHKNSEEFSVSQYLNPEPDDSLGSSKNFDRVTPINGMLSNSRSSDYLIEPLEALEDKNNGGSSDYLIEPLEALEDKNNGGSSDYLVEHFEAPENKVNIR